MSSVILLTAVLFLSSSVAASADTDWKTEDLLKKDLPPDIEALADDVVIEQHQTDISGVKTFYQVK